MYKFINFNSKSPSVLRGNVNDWLEGKKTNIKIVNHSSYSEIEILHSQSPQNMVYGTTPATHHVTIIYEDTP
jgi:hypothetical protein